MPKVLLVCSNLMLNFTSDTVQEEGKINMVIIFLHKISFSIGFASILKCPFAFPFKMNTSKLSPLFPTITFCIRCNVNVSWNAIKVSWNGNCFDTVKWIKIGSIALLLHKMMRSPLKIQWMYNKISKMNMVATPKCKNDVPLNCTIAHQTTVHKYAW